MNRLWCPKCGSTNLKPEQDRSFEPDPWILACYGCGNRVYGQENILKLAQRQGYKPPERPAPVLVAAPPPPPPPTIQVVAPVVEVQGDDDSRRRRGKLRRKCALCGITVWRRPYDVKSAGSTRFYCCREHLNEARRRQFEADKAARTDEVVVPIQVEAPKTKRTSRKVAAPAPSAPMAGASTALARPPEHKAGRKRVTQRRGAILKSCTVCGKELWRRPFDVKDAKSGHFFCCRDHYQQWRTMPHPEGTQESVANATVRNSLEESLDYNARLTAMAS